MRVLAGSIAAGLGLNELASRRYGRGAGAKAGRQKPTWPRNRSQSTEGAEAHSGICDPSKGGHVKSGPEIPISRLRTRLNGNVIAPDDPDYDYARRVFFTGFDRRPAAIVRVADTSDVSRVVTLAGETGAELALRSGGHSRAGHGTSEGGIVIDLSEMNAVEIDAVQLSPRCACAHAALDRPPRGTRKPRAQDRDVEASTHLTLTMHRL
jgi:FAD binding domain